MGSLFFSSGDLRLVGPELPMVIFSFWPVSEVDRMERRRTDDGQTDLPISVGIKKFHNFGR